MKKPKQRKKLKIRVPKYVPLQVKNEYKDHIECVVCDCECHKTTVMHFMACCNQCYQRYYDKDGNFDAGRYYNVLICPKEAYLFRGMCNEI
jgi:hypothetical protein